jgi:deoxyribose-phosphate aldolase
MEDITAVTTSISSHSTPATLKVIIETSLLETDEIAVISFIVRHIKMTHPSGSVLAFIKTSTGFAGGGATLPHVTLMSDIVRDSSCGVKASGGVGDYKSAVDMINVGATRIGASKGVAIVSGGTDGSVKGGY